MKRIFSIVAVLSAMFLSCSKVNDLVSEVGENENEMVLKARIADDSKTYFEATDANHMKLLWSKNDCIDVVTGNSEILTPHVFSMKDVEGQGAGYANATFEGKIASGENPVMALYPSGSIRVGKIFDIKTLFEEPLPPGFENAKDYFFLSFDSLLENQKYSPNPDGNLNYMFSPIVGDELVFSNLCSYFKFQLKGDAKVGKVVISAVFPSGVSFYVLGVITDNDGKIMLIEPIVKTYEYPDPKLNWSEWTNPIDEITLDCGEGVQLSDEQKPFYIAVNSQFFENGFTLRIYDTEGNLLYNKTNNNKIELKPGQIQPIAPITLNASATIKTINPISSLYLIPGEVAGSDTMILCEEGLSINEETGDFTGQGRAVQFGITCGSKYSETQWDGKTDNARLISRDSQTGAVKASSITDIYTSLRDCGVDSEGNNLVGGEVSFTCNSERYTLFFRDLRNLFSSKPVPPQPGTVTITISTETGTKSSVRDNGELILNKGELVSVNGEMFQIEEDGSTQSLTVPYCELGYDVVYPAELFGGSLSVQDGEYNVSAVHSYTQTDQPKPLLFAHITNESLYGNLINSDATLRIGLAEGFKPSYVVMNATGENAFLWGNFKYIYRNGSLVGCGYQAPEDGADQKSIKITIDPSSEYHYINIPPCTMSGFTLTFYNEAGDILQQKTMTREFTVNAGYLYALGTFDNSDDKLPAGALPGKFSIRNGESQPVKHIYFSKGNLWYGKVGEAQKSTFNFETNQYDFASTWSTGHVSHFYWSKSSYEAIKQEYDFGVSCSTNDEFFTVNIEGTEQIKWRALSTAEWQYLFNYGNHQNSIRKDKYKPGVTICGKDNCVVLLPDDWDTSIISLAVFANTTEYSEETAVKWSEMEKAGAVCLPAMGRRLGTDIQSVGVVGRYWSSSPGNNKLAAYYVAFGNDYLTAGSGGSMGGGSRSNGYSIRLVTECK